MEATGKSSCSTRQDTPCDRLPISCRTFHNRAIVHTEVQGEPGSCEVSMQVAPYHLTSLCLGKEARHLIFQFCHLSEDRVCPCTCCIPHHYLCSSTEEHPVAAPTRLTGYSRPLGLASITY